jgi:peptidoglycan/xylan/chitin deacetylase (PgdA/CDA1 family)
VTDREWFESCIREISSVRQVLPLQEVARDKGKGTCALTFDDGLQSVVDVAHPVLSERGLPYTVFLCTDVLTGGPVPWFMRIDHLTAAIGSDPLRAEWHLGEGNAKSSYEVKVALKEIPLDLILSGLARLEQVHGIAPPATQGLFMSPSDISQLSADGVCFGAHTHRHPILSTLSTADQRDEIETSRDEVERLSGIRPSQFAYPNGSRLDFDSSTESMLRASGFTNGYTTIQRHLSTSDEALALPRIGIEQGDGRIRRMLKQVTPEMSRNHAVEARIRARTNRDRRTATAVRSERPVS